MYLCVHEIIGFPRFAFEVLILIHDYDYNDKEDGVIDYDGGDDLLGPTACF